MKYGTAWKCIAALLMMGSFVATSRGQTYQKLFQEMRWRCIGPFRAGRTVAITGVTDQPNLFYMAAVNGGVWKTTDFGNTWTPIFDNAGSSGSVGALAVAPSNSNVIYVGSGEGLQRPDLAVGDGMYKSIDAGKTFSAPKMLTAVGSISRANNLVVDQYNGNLYATYMPVSTTNQLNLLKSTDGGTTWTTGSRDGGRWPTWDDRALRRRRHGRGNPRAQRPSGDRAVRD